MRAGDSGRVRARLAASSRRARSRSRTVSVVTSCSRIGGEPGAVLLLGKHAVEGGLQVGPDRRYGVLLVQEREGVFQPAAVVRQLVGGQCVQGCSGCSTVTGSMGISAGPNNCGCAGRVKFLLPIT